MPILNLNDGVPRTFHSARNLNARVPRTCFENILPGSCTENIYERAQRVPSLRVYMSIINAINHTSVWALPKPGASDHISRVKIPSLGYAGTLSAK